MKYAAYLVFICAVGCHNFKEVSFADTSADAVLQQVDTALIPHTLKSRASVKRFYELRDLALFWNLDPAADSLMRIVAGADQYGLDPNEYHIEEVTHLMADSLSADRFMRMDVLLTDAWMTLCSHVRHGRLDPKTLQKVNYAARINDEAIALLGNRPIPSMADLDRLEPHVRQYQELKKILRSYLGGSNADTTRTRQMRQLALNMERWRWQRPLPDRYVSVNIPAFMLRVFEKDSLWLETRVIVGKRETPTPVMESVIKSFVIYPYWHVPRSIATKEILPVLIGDASYLRRNNFDVLNRDGVPIRTDTIQWDFYTADNFPFILRQREGSENSMGIIKFNFSNNYGVYLHDTNSKRLFARAKRDLSHGCVRVSNAVAFAHYLVREDDIYVSPEDLDQYLSLQQRLKIDLRKPVTLKLDYFTAEVRKGVPYFLDDIYKKDSVMMRNLQPTPAERIAARGF